MSKAWRWLGWLAAALLGAGYLTFNYVTAASEHPSVLALLLSLIPLGALALGKALQSRAKNGLLLVGVPLTLGAVWWGMDALRDHVAWLYLVQHLGAMLAMALLFGATLGRGHDRALCSQIAALLSDATLDADYLRYTWQVTWAWTLFFLGNALVSVVLFTWAPVSWWSLFANVGTPVLTGVMFVAEYGMRVWRLPDRPHFSIASTINAYQRFTQRKP